MSPLGKAYARPLPLSSRETACRTTTAAFCPLSCHRDVVPEERLELSWPCGRRILSPLRLPVPPFRPQRGRNYNSRPMLVSEFDYALPAELIAQHPAPAAQREPPAAPRRRERRAAATSRSPTCPAWSTRGDALVLNDTRVIKARLAGRKASGGKIELFVERVARRARGARADPRQPPAGGRAASSWSTTSRSTVVGREGDLYRVRFAGGRRRGARALRRGAAAALHPRTRRSAEDAERYQTVYADDARRGRRADRRPAFRSRRC